MMGQGNRRVQENKLQLFQTVCAVVVIYFPDEECMERIRQILPQVGKVVVVDNTPPETGSMDVRAAMQELPNTELIENRVNKGIAEALNQGLAFAAKEGYEWLLTLDQDTQCHPDMVTTLIRLSKICQPRPLVLGSNYFDPQTNRTKVPVGQNDDDFLAQKTVITSGCLIDVKLAISIGGFRADYFIDQVDHEFCLRARANGYAVIISRKPLMTHSVGRPGGVRLPFLGVLPNHPPVRKYYIARNTVVTVANYWRREPLWCTKRLIRLILGLFEMAVLERNRLRKVRAFFTGIVDGLNQRLGACLNTWL
ncbi:MAG: glycosyltransferase [Betaproteobacteria bacterium HGW-Betaproteobacteria-18]|nr:MAG: glycosyltransferase [Betaproteobacteria bacterium HGW-Betaproteobacteria-18]